MKPSLRKAESYGLHLMLDGYGAPAAKLADVNLLYTVLSNLPGEIGMHRVGFPHIIQFLKGQIAGLSGFAFIIESHVSIHTYARKGFLSLDVYSCKKFNAGKVVRRITKIFGLKDVEVYVQERGKKFHLQRPSNLRGGNLKGK